MTGVTTTIAREATVGTEGNSVSFKYGDQTGTYLIGADNNATAANFVTAINAIAGSTVAVATNAAVAVTAPTVGTALPLITFTAAAGDSPSVAYTTANVVAADTAAFDLSSYTDVTNVTASVVGGANVKLAGTQDMTIVNAADATDGAGEVQVAGGKVLNITTSGTGSVDVDGKDITEVTVTGGSGGVDIDNLGGSAGTTTAEGTTLTKVTLTKVDGDSTVAGDALLDVTIGGATTAARTVTISNDQAAAGHDLALTAAGTGYKSDGTTEVQTVVTDTNAKQIDLNVTAKSSVDLTNNSAMKTLNVTGEGAVKVAADMASLTKIDASENSGGVNLGAVNAKTVSITGGSGVDKVEVDTAAKYTFDLGAGNDEFTLGATVSAGTSIDGGTGLDKFIIDDADAYNSPSELAAFKNFDVLVANDGSDNAAENYNMSVFAGFTAIEVGANGHADDDITFSNVTATQAANIQVNGDQTGKLIVSLADATGTADVVSIVYGTGKTDTAAVNQAEALEVNGVETLNLSTNAGPTASDTETVMAAFTGDKLTAINLTGSKFDLSNAATTKAVTIDGSALTGGLKVAGNLKVGSTVKGSEKVDTIALGNTGSTYNLGAGKDSITGVTASKLTDGSDYATIDGGADVDTLTFATGAGITLTDASFTKLSNVEKIVSDNDGGAYAFSLTGGSEFSEAFSAGFEADIEVGDEAVTLAASSATVAIKFDVNSSADASKDINVTTGSAADTIIIVTDALTTSEVNVNTGAGDDSVSYTHSTGTMDLSSDAHDFDLGTGADTLTLSGYTAGQEDHAVIKVEAGDSTTTAYDTVTGFVANSGSALGMNIDFDGTAAIATAVTSQAVAGYTSSEAALSSSAAGLVTWSGTATLTLEEKIASVVAEFVGANETVVFEHQTDSYVFHNDVDGDSLIALLNVDSSGLEISSGTTAGEIFIA